MPVDVRKGAWVRKKGSSKGYVILPERRSRKQEPSSRNMVDPPVRSRHERSAFADLRAQPSSVRPSRGPAAPSAYHPKASLPYRPAAPKPYRPIAKPSASRFMQQPAPPHRFEPRPHVQHEPRVRTVRHSVPLPGRRPAAKEARPRSQDLYEKIKKIGEGGQGACYLVKRVRDNRLLVSKTMKGWVGGKPSEVSIFCNILPEHDRIIRLVDYMPSLFSPKLVFEYCAGGDLLQIMNNSRKYGKIFPETFLWHVFRQVAEALALLHFGHDRRARDPDRAPRGWTKVVHRDMKPDNIFLREPYVSGRPFPSIVLGDFGCATLTACTNFIAVKEWAAPEMPLATARGDVWGLGAIIHSMAHGLWSPFPDEERKIPVPITPRYSEALNGMMMRTLIRDRRKRIDSRELLRQLLRYDV